MAIKRITTNLIKDSDIATVDIANNAITAAKITDGNITTAKLADLSVTAGKLAGTLDLTGKTITVATATTGDSDTSPASTAFVQQEIAALVDSSPSSLNTLNELAAALGDDASFSTTVTNSIATKLPLAGGTMTGDLKVGATIASTGGTTNSRGMLLAHQNNTNQSYVGRSENGVADTGNRITFDYDNDKMQLDSDGDIVLTPTSNVGIGTTSPNTTLTLSDGTDEFDFGVTANQLLIKSVTSDGSDDQRIIIDAGNGGLSSTRGAYIALSGNEASAEPGHAIYQMGNVTGSAHVFRKAGGSDAVTIDSSGNVQIVDGGKLVTKTTSGEVIRFERASDSNRYSSIHANSTDAGGAFIQFKVHTGATATSLADVMTLKGDGNVGIGTTSTDSKLHVKTGTAQNDAHGLLKIEQTSTSSGSAATNAGITTKNHHGTSQFMQWEDYGVRIGSRILTNSGIGDVVFTAGSDSEKMRIKSDGQITTQGDILPGADVIMNNGRGISFAATANSSGSMSNELLDDYEEGTWTPAASGATLTTASGLYTKIGNQVTVHYHVVTTGGLPTSTAVVRIQNLPFTTGSSFTGAAPVYARYYTPNDSTLTSILADGDTFIRLININEQNFDYTIWGELEASHNNSVDIRGTATYIV
jgi:hypothetical protein